MIYNTELNFNLLPHTIHSLHLEKDTQGTSQLHARGYI